MRRPSSALDGLVREGDGVLVLGLEALGADAWGVLAASGLRLLRVAETAAAVAVVADGAAQVVVTGTRHATGADRRGPRAPRAGRRARRRLRRPRLPGRAARGARLRRGRRDAHPVRAGGARGAGRDRAARGAAAGQRGDAALARRQHPRRHLPLRVRRRLDDGVAERRDRGDHRLSGQRLHRQRGAHVREHRASRRPRVRGAVGHGVGRHRPAVRARVPARAAGRLGALGARARPGPAVRRRPLVARRRDLRHHRPPRGRAGAARARGHRGAARGGPRLAHAHPGRRRPRAPRHRAQPPRRRPAAPGLGRAGAAASGWRGTATCPRTAARRCSTRSAS